MSIRSEVRKLSQNPHVELFCLDLARIGVAQQHYFCNGVAEDGSKVSFDGHAYEPWAIEATGYERNGGAQPRPTLTLGDPLGVISVLARQHQNLVGAAVIRRRTKLKFLDGQPEADPTQQLVPDVYYVARKAQSGGPDIQFELCSPLELQGVRIPGRTITTSGCKWEYRGADCGYTGSAMFDQFDQPVDNPAEDRCGYRVSSCKCRFGEQSPLPFGAFPGVKRYG